MYTPKSEKELEIIRTLMEFPDRDWSLKQISQESGISKTTVWRSVNRLEDRDFLTTSKVGNSKVVRVKNRNVLCRILKLARVEIDELEEVAEEFADEVKELGDVKRCVLFGSVARGTADLNSDVDVLVLVDEKGRGIEDEILQTAERISSERSARVMPDIMEESRFGIMKKHGDSFAENIEKEGIKLYEARKDEQTS